MRNSRFVSSIFFGYPLILEYKLPEEGEPWGARGLGCQAIWGGFQRLWGWARMGGELDKEQRCRTLCCVGGAG